MFTNRQQAGSLLAKEVVKLLQANPQIDKSGLLVLALPRGGVTVAAEVAMALHRPLDIIASKKIGAPDQKN